MTDGGDQRRRDFAHRRSGSAPYVTATAGDGRHYQRRRSDYVEILFDIRGCHRETCRVVLGVFRNLTESALESAIADQLGAHVDEHQAERRSPA